MKRRIQTGGWLFVCLMGGGWRLDLDSHIILKKGCRTHRILELRLVLLLLLLHVTAATRCIGSTATASISIVAVVVDDWTASVLLVDHQIVETQRELSDRAEVRHLLGLRRWWAVALRGKHAVVSSWSRWSSSTATIVRIRLLSCGVRVVAVLLVVVQMVHVVPVISSRWCRRWSITLRSNRTNLSVARL
mgnify:CR=1 FL=1